MWNIMNLALDFLGVFFLLRAPCHYCSGECSPSSHCLQKGTWMRFHCFLSPFGKMGEGEGIWAGVMYVQVPVTHGVFLGAMVWLIRCSVSTGMYSLFEGFFNCPVSHLHLSVGSPLVLCKDEWEVPSGFCIDTLFFCLHQMYPFMFIYCHREDVWTEPFAPGFWCYPAVFLWLQRKILNSGRSSENLVALGSNDEMKFNNI